MYISTDDDDEVQAHPHTRWIHNKIDMSFVSLEYLLTITQILYKTLFSIEMMIYISKWHLASGTRIVNYFIHSGRGHTDQRSIYQCNTY